MKVTENFLSGTFVTRFNCLFTQALCEIIMDVMEFHSVLALEIKGISFCIPISHTKSVCGNPKI